MKKLTRRFILSLAALSLCAGLSAQTFLLEDFGDGSSTTGSVTSGTSWAGVGNTTLLGTSLAVAGTALSDSGWGAINLTLPDLATYSYVALRAELSADNAATNIFVTFDDGSSTQTVTFLASDFTVGSMTTVYEPVTWSLTTTTVEAWNIGGGATPPGTGSPAFRMIFDNLELSATGAPIPEPSTYTAIFGALALGFVAYRRRITVRV